LQTLADGLEYLQNLETIEISTHDYCFENKGNSIAPQTQVPDRLTDLAIIQLRHLMLASSLIEGGLRFHTLIINEAAFTRHWVRVDFDRALDPYPPFEDSSQMFEHIRTFIWTPIPREFMGRDNVIHFLSSMKALENFDLRHPAACESGEWPLDLMLAIHQDVTWPCLKSLSIENLYGEEGETLAFMERHKSTLRSVHLRHPTILQILIKDFLRCSREVVNLDEFMLDGCITGERRGLGRGMGRILQWKLGRDDEGGWYGKDAQSQKGLCEEINAFVTRRSEEYPGFLLTGGKIPFDRDRFTYSRES